MPSFEFELNCFLTTDSSRLSRIQFKELRLTSKLNYPELREVLSGTQAIWYAYGDSIYLVGDERELREKLSSNDIATGTASLVEYAEMFEHRELVLRAVLHSALSRFMMRNDFRPSIGRRSHSYYPYFHSTRNDVQLTTKVVGQGFTALFKDGLQFAFDLSPEGRALLWIDVKAFPFVHLDSPETLGSGPVYIFCINSDYFLEVSSTYPTDFLPVATDDAALCEALTQGAFLEESGDVYLDVPCVSFGMEQPAHIVCKAGHKSVQVPYEWVYTTASTRTLRELDIYDRWLGVAMKPAPERYQLMKDLIDLIAQDDESLVIPFPDEQRLVFSLSPIKFTQEVEWYS
jgi:hypothetical protein